MKHDEFIYTFFYLLPLSLRELAFSSTLDLSYMVVSETTILSGGLSLCLSLGTLKACCKMSVSIPICFTICVTFSQLGSSISRLIFSSESDWVVLSCSVCIIFKLSMAASSHFLQNQCVPSPFIARNLYFGIKYCYTLYTPMLHTFKCKAIVSAGTAFLHFPAHLGGAKLNVNIFTNNNFKNRKTEKTVHSTCPLPNCLFFSSILFYTTLCNSLNYTISDDKLTTPSCIHVTGSAGSAIPYPRGATGYSG